jgi:hypothetical protein
MRNKFGLWVLILFIFMSIPFAYGEEAVTEKKEGKSGAFDKKMKNQKSAI